MRAYWTEQWSEIDPHVEPVAFHGEPDGSILVDVHQVVRELNGAVLADEHVGHRFTLTEGLIRKMEVLCISGIQPHRLTTCSSNSSAATDRCHQTVEAPLVSPPAMFCSRRQLRFAGGIAAARHGRESHPTFPLLRRRAHSV